MWSSSEEKKMVRRLKDILHDRPEHEICAMLQECNMDPDEAVQRLLSQDTFQEVKSKREKRKEMREIQDLKPRIGGGARNGGWSCDRDEGETIVQSDSIACGTSMYKGETVSVISSQHPPCPPAAETANLQLHDRDYLDSVTKGHPGGICNKANSFTRQPVKSKPSGPIAGTRRPSVIDTITRSSLCNGSLGFADTEMSPNCEGGGQGSSGYLSTVATNGSGVTHHSMSPLKHFSSNGESTNKTSPLEGKTLADQTSVDAGAVVLPSHLQALAADCSHLSFGTYKPRSSSTTTGLPLPNSSSNDSKMSTTAGKRPSTKSFYTEECFLTETHEPPSTQLTRQQILGAASGSGQMLAVSDLVSQGSQNKTPNIIHEHAYASSHMKEELGYLKAMQGNSLTSTGQSFRTPLAYSTCMEAPPMPLGYRTGGTPSNCLSVSLPERTSPPNAFPPFEPSSWTSHGIHGLPQLLDQACSQQTKPLKYVDLNSYQNIPQDYGQIPFHHSPGSIRHNLAQYGRGGLMQNLALANLGSSIFGSLHGSNTLLQPSSTIAANLSPVVYSDMLQNHINFDTHRSIAAPRGLGGGDVSNSREIAIYNLLERERKRREQDQQYSWNHAPVGNFSSFHSQVESNPDNQLLQSFGAITLDEGKAALSKQHQL